MKTKLLIVLLLSSLFAVSQTKFETGYYISNGGSKINCLIKNYDWKNNPTKFEIKNSSTDAVQNISINEIKELGIDNEVKFIKSDVNIDTSSDNIQTMDTIKEPKFNKRTVLLKVLVEGSNNLYTYEDSDIATKFFYSNKGTSEITPLIYKRYVRETTVHTNETYKQQLNNSVSCNNNTSSIQNLNYILSDLEKYFINTNRCQGDSSSKVIAAEKNFIIKIKPLVTLLSSKMNLDMKTGNLIGTHSMENKMLYGFGAEIESLLPFNHYNWGLFIQPTYVSSYSSTVQGMTQYYFNYTINAKYNYFQVPIGVRRYIPINENSKIFINLAYNYAYVMNSSKLQINGDAERQLKNNDFFTGNLNFGLGYQFKMLSAEVSNCLPINNNVGGDNAKFGFTAFTLKYTLFSSK